MDEYRKKLEFWERAVNGQIEELQQQANLRRQLLEERIAQLEQRTAESAEQQSLLEEYTAKAQQLQKQDELWEQSTRRWQALRDNWNNRFPSVDNFPDYAHIAIPSGRWLSPTFINKRDGQELVYIPAGEFFEPRGGNKVPLDSYVIGRCPVTNSQYAGFIRAGGYDDRQYWSDAGWEMRTKEKWTQPAYWDDKQFKHSYKPVVGVSWYEAEAYCTWAGLRLPSVAQWRKAGRGGVFLDGDADRKIKNPLPQRTYPWGDQAPNADGIWRANYEKTPVFGDKSTSPVGYFPLGRSPYGCLDMAGNVWEWCDDWYDDGKSRVLLGGSWLNGFEWDLEMANRFDDHPGVRDRRVGLRASGPLGA